MVSRWSTLGLILIASASLSCASKHRQPDPQTSPSSMVTSSPPFKTKEPDTYQGVRSITFTSAGEGQSSMTTTTIARDGNYRREEDESRGKKIVYLEVPGGSFVLLPDENIYAEVVGPTVLSLPSEPLEDTYVHTAPIQSTYENLGTDTVNGTTTTKYKVTVNTGSADGVTQSETFIWIDESLGIPIKSVTSSAQGTRTMELTQVTLKVDKSQFEIPKGYQKVEMTVLQQRAR